MAARLKKPIRTKVAQRAGEIRLHKSVMQNQTYCELIINVGYGSEARNSGL